MKAASEISVHGTDHYVYNGVAVDMGLVLEFCE